MSVQESIVSCQLEFKPWSLFFSLKNTETSCPFWFWVTWTRKVGTTKTSRMKRRSKMKGMAGWGSALCCCMASWGLTEKSAAGSSRLLPPCGRWPKRRRGGAWSGRHSWAGWVWWARWRAGGRKWRCGGSWATAACGRRRWLAACGTAPGSGPESALGKCSWLIKKWKNMKLVVWYFWQKRKSYSNSHKYFNVGHKPYLCLRCWKHLWRSRPFWRLRPAGPPAPGPALGLVVCKPGNTGAHSWWRVGWESAAQ